MDITKIWQEQNPVKLFTLNVLKAFEEKIAKWKEQNPNKEVTEEIIDALLKKK